MLLKRVDEKELDKELRNNMEIILVLGKDDFYDSIDFHDVLEPKLIFINHVDNLQNLLF